MDEEFRVTRFEGHLPGVADSVFADILGKRPWEVERQEIGGGWESYRAQLTAHQPFNEAIVHRTLPDATRIYLTISGEPVFDAARRFRGYRGVGRDITARKRAEQLQALEHAVNRSLANAGSVTAAIHAAVRAICESEGWECGRYFRWDDRDRVLRFSDGWGVPVAAVEQFLEKSRDLSYAPGAGLAGRVWQSGQPLWVPDVTQDSRVVTVGLFRDTGMRGAFVFPVVSEADGKSIGVLAFNSRKVRKPDERLLQAVQVIVSQIGQFLQRRHAEEVLRESEARFRFLTELSSDWYWAQDTQHRFTEISGSVLEKTGLKTEEFLGKTLWDPFFQIKASEQEWAGYKAALDAHEAVRDFAYKQVLRDGRTVFYSARCRPVRDERGVFAGYRGVGRDITEQKRAEERVQYLATHDDLTRLPNRSMFTQLLNLTVHTAGRYKHQFAVLFIDLDRFKSINDTLGHEAGDTLLKEMAGRLKETLRASDIVARLGGDEFVVLAPEVNDTNQVATLARKILSAAIKPMLISGHECRVTVSVGISMFPADAQDEESLIKNADLAMYLAKEEGKNNFQFYSKDIKSQSLERLALETNLRQALERGEFSLHYQAKLALKTGAITGVEALLRWQNTALGTVSPAQFIPVAEDTGLIVPIGKWVLRTACAQNMAWQRQGLAPVCIAVNLSPRQFVDPSLLEEIAAVLRDTGMAPGLLELEITEGMMMGNVDRAIKILTAVSQMGVRLAIDDFGTGYSSLAQIKRFPIDTVKVDRSFIRDLMQNSEDRAITEAIIAMGKALSLTVVAEGVETAEQESYLREHACDESQGYYFSKPTTPDKFAELLGRHIPSPRN